MRLLRYLVATALAFLAIGAYGASLADEITTGVKTPPIGPGAAGPLVIRAQILLDRARFPQARSTAYLARISASP